MKTELRRDLALLPFEEKIRKVAELIQLSRTLKTPRVHDDAQNHPQSGDSLPATTGTPKSSM
jgi:hypothetical protein